MNWFIPRVDLWRINWRPTATGHRNLETQVELISQLIVHYGRNLKKNDGWNRFGINERQVSIYIGGRYYS